MPRYAVFVEDPTVVRRIYKKYNKSVHAIIIIIDLDKPQRIAPLAQKHRLRIKKLELVL